MYLRKKGFTLIELLVVIAIIALLLSILMPALSMVKEQGKSIVCRSILKTFGAANFTYAAENSDNFVPWSQKPLDPGQSWDTRWPENKDFRSNLGLDGRVKIEDLWDDPYKFPKEHLCPTMPKISDRELSEILGIWSWEMRNSYSYNTEWWVTDGLWYPQDRLYRGHKLTEIKQSSDKMMFIDGNFYQTRRMAANYETFWDVNGDSVVNGGLGSFGQVAYRHRESANMVFFDGHTDKMIKEKVYDIDNPSWPGDEMNRNADLLWDVYGQVPSGKTR